HDVGRGRPHHLRAAVEPPDMAPAVAIVGEAAARAPGNPGAMVAHADLNRMSAWSSAVLAPLPLPGEKLTGVAISGASSSPSTARRASRPSSWAPASMLIGS